MSHSLHKLCKKMLFNIEIPVTTNVTQNLHLITVNHIKSKSSLQKPGSLWLSSDLSPLPSKTLPPLPRYWAFCSASNVFIRKLGATKSSREGLESKRAGRREEELWRRRNLFIFRFRIKGDLGSLFLSFTLFFSLFPHTLFVTSCSPGFTMTRPFASSVGLIFLLIGYTAAGKGCSWVWLRGVGGRTGSQVRQEGPEDSQLGVQLSGSVFVGLIY